MKDSEIIKPNDEIGFVTDALILKRRDLRENCKLKHFDDIDMHDFKSRQRMFHVNNLILFIDDGLQTKLIKNRYGYEGIVVNTSVRI